MSAYPNSDLNPVLAAGKSRVSVISDGTLPARQCIQNINYIYINKIYMIRKCTYSKCMYTSFFN